MIEVGFVYVLVEEVGVTDIGLRKKETWSNKSLKQAVVTNGVWIVFLAKMADHAKHI